MKRTDYDHSKLTGMDADIEISLKEYGFAWIETETEYLFYYGIKNESFDDAFGNINYEHTKFDFCVFDKNIDIKEEFGWVNWDDIYSFIGASEADFFDSPLYHQINYLSDYYGVNSFFGESYWEGLEYNDIVKGE